MKDFYKLESHIYNITGVKPNLVRFPWGSNNKIYKRYTSNNIMKKLTNEIESQGYTYFDWNLNSKDTNAKTVSKNTIVKAIRNNIGNKRDVIILFHDTIYKTTTAEALPEVIDFLISKGYKFNILSKHSYNIKFIIK